MPSIQAISLLLPTTITQGIFSFRRAKKGCENMDENTAYGVGNIGIAGSQVLKAGVATKGIIEGANAISNSEVQVNDSAMENIKNLSKTEKTLKTAKNAAGKALRFTANHVNPIICGVSAVKVLGDDNKKEAALTESINLGTMFAFEGITKNVIGSPKTKFKNGKFVTEEREALYKKNPFIEKQVEAFKDACNVKRTILGKTTSFKCLPPVLKGLLFPAMSIAGYALGEKISANVVPAIIGE